jgi:hypothetical protein
MAHTSTLKQTYRGCSYIKSMFGFLVDNILKQKSVATNGQDLILKQNMTMDLDQHWLKFL